MSDTDKDSQLSKLPLENKERRENPEPTKTNAPQAETGDAYEQSSGVSNGIPVSDGVDMAKMEERKAQFEDELEGLRTREAFSNFMKIYSSEKQKEVDLLKTKLTNVKEGLQAEKDQLEIELANAFDEITYLRLQIEGLRQDHENNKLNPNQNTESSVRTEDRECLLKDRIEALEWVKKKQAEQIKKLNGKLREYEQNVVFQLPDLAMQELGSLPQLEGQFEQFSVQGGEDNKDGTNREHESGKFKQDNSSTMPQLRTEYYCPVSCVSMVISLIFDLMKLPVCNRRLNKKVQNELCLLSMLNNEDFKIGNCSLAFEEFHSVRLIKKKPTFFKKIYNAEDRRDSLRNAIATMHVESNPALFRMHYKENKAGIKRAGHCLAIMPDGKFIDVRKEGYWEPEVDLLWKRVNLIEVWEVDKKIAEQWEKECGLKLCLAECRHNVHNPPL